eukprot:CAMPEP_0176348754 /NCGR_PEP_ID=MMETSP0126-20121128/8126_1 /TAXON_ID=141414 ORGANISM="Strombidinopsis acuminatum, Strain SPMC142" /NCGR_SAMPLE_ID=MMETSP0126 /ASSEMBLY_ACC=CAM_ASM_000229 /LENGTH=119 /DNA_ID=CAMNT_0017697751 /DNA_START=158 /DNA_END=517 /DNA_ORIENTATION=-
MGSFSYLRTSKVNLKDPMMNLQTSTSLPNTTIYATFGYDIITGNPFESGSSIDPGFAAPIFEMFDSGDIHGYTYVDSQSCSNFVMTEIVNGMADLVDELAGTVIGTSGSSFGAPFGGSA